MQLGLKNFKDEHAAQVSLAKLKSMDSTYCTKSYD